MPGIVKLSSPRSRWRIQLRPSGERTGWPTQGSAVILYFTRDGDPTIPSMSSDVNRHFPDFNP